MQQPEIMDIEHGEIQDLVAIIDSLWDTWPSTEDDLTNEINNHAFAPHPNSPLQRKLTTLNRLTQSLCLDDQFLARLYKLGIPPANLTVDNNRLQGTPSSTNETIILRHAEATHIPAKTTFPPAHTEEIIDTLIAEAGVLQPIHPHQASVSLARALAYYSDDNTTQAIKDKKDLSRAIIIIEKKIQARIETSVLSKEKTKENHDILKITDALDSLRKQTIRYGNDLDILFRPSPMSHLGYNLTLSREVLLSLSKHEDFQALCNTLDANAQDIRLSRNGQIKATHKKNQLFINAFDTHNSPESLVGITRTLVDIANLCNTDISSTGTMRISEALDYYAIPHDMRSLDWGTDESIEKLSDSLKSRLSLGEETRPHTDFSQPSLRTPPFMYTKTCQLLWATYDSSHSRPSIDLTDIDFPSPINSAIQQEWYNVQGILFDFHKCPIFWVIMRNGNLSLNSLSIEKNHICLSGINDKNRRIIFKLEDFIDSNLKDNIGHLFIAAEKFGTITHRPLPSLSSALCYQSPFFPDATRALFRQHSMTRLDMLKTINLLFQRYGDLNFSSYFSDEKRDLDEIHNLISSEDNIDNLRYRPSIGTTLGKHLSHAINDFLILLTPSTPSNHADDCYDAIIDSRAELKIVCRQQPNLFIEYSELIENTQKTAFNNLKQAVKSLGVSLSSDGTLLLTQALSHYLSDAYQPQATKQALIRHVEAHIGRLGCGFRHELIDAAKLLSSQDEIVISKVVSRHLKKNRCELSLFEFLGNKIAGQHDLTWKSTERWLYFVYKMISSEEAHTIAERLFKSLHWYGKSAQEPPSSIATASLLIHTLLLNLGPPSSKHAKKVLGYYINKRNNLGRSFVEIYKDFNNYVKSLGHISDHVTDMACIFAANRIAPELLATDSTIRLNASLMTVEYVSGVNLAESLAGGTSQSKSTDELISLADSLVKALPDDQLNELITQHRLHPILHWFKHRNRKIELAAQPIVEAQVKEAFVAFERRKLELQKTFIDIRAPTPNRMAIVKEEIQRVFPKYPGIFRHFPWDTSEIRLLNQDDIVSSYPFYEVYASEESPEKFQNWSMASMVSIIESNSASAAIINNARREAFAEIKTNYLQLKNIRTLFETRYDAYIKNLANAYKTLIEETLYQLPDRLIDAIHRGDFEIFTLRPPIPQLEAQQEHPGITNKYRGRLGVLLKIRDNHETSYHQLLPLQEICSPLPSSFTFPPGGIVTQRKIRTVKGNATIYAREGTPLPLDWSAYLLGTVPEPEKISSLIVEPLTALSSSNLFEPDSSTLFPKIVQPLVHDLLFYDEPFFKAVCWGETSLEKDIKKSSLSKAVDFLVPFVENLRNLKDSNPTLDPEAFSSAAFFLYIEFILLAIPFSKNLSSVIKSSKSVTFSRLSRASLKSTIEALNPTSGLVSSAKIIELSASASYKIIHQQFLKQYQKIKLPSAGWRCQNGIAYLRQPLTSLLASRHTDIESASRYHVMVRPTDTASGFHLVDPATLSAYGPELENAVMHDAAGIMSNALVRSQSVLNTSVVTKSISSSKPLTRLSENNELNSHYELLEIADHEE